MALRRSTSGGPARIVFKGGSRMDASALSALIRFDRARSFQELADCAMDMMRTQP